MRGERRVRVRGERVRGERERGIAAAEGEELLIPLCRVSIL